jgi:signal transduction histidine kinase
LTPEERRKRRLERLRQLRFRKVLVVAAFFAAYWIGARVGLYVQAAIDSFPLFWPPAAISLVALVFFGSKFWPLVFFGSLLSNVTLGMPVLPAMVVSLGSAFEAWLGIFVLRLFVGSKPTLASIREVVVFVGLAVIAATGVGVTLKIGALWISGVLPADRAFVTWRAWWLGEVTADVILGGAAIAWVNDLRFRLARVSTRKWELLALGLLVAMISALNFTPLIRENPSLLLRPYFLFTLMLWAAFRFDLFGVIYTALIYFTTAFIGTLQGFSNYASHPPDDRIVLLQLFSVMLASTGLVLAAAVREKERAVDARDEFLGIASHELKTPITSLKLQIQIERRKLERVGAAASEAHLAFAKGMERQANRLVHIVEQLLDVSRLGRHRVPLDLSEFDASELLRDLAARLAPDLALAKNELDLRLQPGLICRWDSFRIEQIVENLLSNAMKYAPGKPVILVLAENGDEVEIIVRDEGPGIPEEKQGHIFNRFVRANASPNIKGLGLGLFITKQLVEAHGGRIWARSKNGEGTTFYIQLPRRVSETFTTDEALV